MHAKTTAGDSGSVKFDFKLLGGNAAVTADIDLRNTANVKTSVSANVGVLSGNSAVGQYSKTLNFTIPSTLAPGTYDFILKLKQSNSSSEQIADDVDGKGIEIIGSITVLDTSTKVTALDATYTGLPYDGATAELEAPNASAAGSFAFEYVGTGATVYAATSTAPTNAGTYRVKATFTPTDTAAYNSSFDVANFEITKASLTITALSQTKTYDNVAYSGGNDVTYSGFVNGETSAVLGGSLSYGGSSQGATDAGTYDIAASGLTSGNYAISYVDGTLTINKAVLTGEATTQAALNVAKNGTLAWTVKIDANSIVGGETVADLFNGAKFTLNINGVDYALQSTASVVDGIVYVNWTVDAGLKDALDNYTTSANTSASTAAVGVLTVSATTNGGNYCFSDDFLTKLFYSLKK